MDSNTTRSVSHTYHNEVCRIVGHLEEVVDQQYPPQVVGRAVPHEHPAQLEDE